MTGTQERLTATAAVIAEPPAIPPIATMSVLEERYDVPSPDDDSLVSITAVKGFTAPHSADQPWFNGVEYLATRELTVTGMNLSWDGSVRALEAIRTTRDVTSVTIIADTVVIAEPVAWKGAQVTIVARSLVFRDNGCISTVPEPYGADAFTVDRDEAGLPIDATNAVRAAGGLPGCAAGDIVLNIKNLELGKPGVTRFDCTGGAGQKGERGGYLTNRPDKEATHLRSLKLQDVIDLLNDPSSSTGDLAGCNHWWYPNYVNAGGEEWRVTDDIHKLKYVESFDSTSRPVIGVDILLHFMVFLGEQTKPLSIPAGRLAQPSPPIPFASGPSGAGGSAGSLCVPTALVPLAGGAFTGRGGSSPLSDDIPGKQGTPEQFRMLRYTFAQNSAPMRGISSLRAGYWDGAAAVGEGRKGSQSAAGKDGAVRALPVVPVESWLDPRLIRQVVTFARKQLAMGHRDDALETVRPYYLGLKAASGSLTPSTELAGCWQSLDALLTNMTMNLDLYGHPAGWVPRFSANSYFSLYLTDRAFSYKFCYLMNKALDLSESNDRAWQVLSTVASQTDAAIDHIHTELGAAYRDFHVAQERLQDTLKEMQAFQREMDALKQAATNDAIEKEKRDRIIKAVFNTAGAICSALPVGQPYLSGVGAVLSGVGDATSKLDPSAGGPEQALSFLSNLSGQVSTTLASSADTFKSQFDANLKAKYKDRPTSDELDLRKQISAGRTSLAEAETAANRDAWTVFTQAAADTRLKALLSTQAAEAEALTAHAADRAALRAKIDEANKQIADLPESPGAEDTISGELAAKVRQNLLAARSKLYAQLADLDNAVVAARKKSDGTAASIQAIKDDQDRRREAADQRDKLDALLTKLDTAEDKRGDEKAKATFAKALDSTVKTAKGISIAASSIRDALLPISAEDQSIQTLRDTILKSGYKHQFEAALDNLEKAKASRAQALQGLQECSKRMLTGIADLQQALNAAVLISQNRQTLAAGMDPGVKTAIRAMAQSATERMDYYLYLVRKAYMYEQLAPVGAQLAQVNDFTHRFDTWVAANRAPLPSGAAMPTAADRTGQLAALDKVLGSDFGAMGDKVLAETLNELAMKILDHRQQHGVTRSNTFQVALDAATLATLVEEGSVAFDRMADLLPRADAARFLSTHARVRVAALSIENLLVTPSVQRVSTPLRFEFTVGRTFPLKNDDGTYYLFRLAEREKQIAYGFTVKQLKAPASASATTPAAAAKLTGTITPDSLGTVDDVYKTIMTKATGSSVQYLEMAPSVLADLQLDFTMGRDQIERIDSLDLTLTLQFD